MLLNMPIKYTEIPTLFIQNKWNYVEHIGQPLNYIKGCYFLIQSRSFKFKVLNWMKPQLKSIVWTKP